MTNNYLEQISTATNIASDARISFEFFPPKNDHAYQQMILAARHLSRFNPDFVSVTYGTNQGVDKAAGTATALKTISAISEIMPNTSIAAHFTAFGFTKKEANDLLEKFIALDIKHIVALRGDLQDRRQLGDFHHASDLVLFLRQEYGDYFEISVAGYPEKHPEAVSLEQDMINLKKKIDHGANRIITQFFFENQIFSDFLDNAISVDIKTPITAGLLPIYNFSQMSSFAARCETSIPPALHKIFKKEHNNGHHAISVALLLMQCSELYNLYNQRNFHFYSLNHSAILTEMLEYFL